MPGEQTLYADNGNSAQQEGGRVGLSWPSVAISLLILLLMPLAGLWLMGCQNPGTPAASPSPSLESAAIVTALPPDTSTPPAPTPTAPAVITLTLWTAPAYSPQAEGAAGEVMRQLLATFNEQQENIQIEYVLKKAQRSKGGLLDFLLTASSVAPSVLPDVVFLEPHDLRDAASAGLLQPLDDLLPLSIEEDLFPFVLEAGRFEGQLKGLPFQADVLHLLYNTNKIESAPLTWTDVLTRTEAHYLFPAGGQAGLASDSFLIHYLSTGASLFDEIGQLALDQEAMTAVLSYYATGVQSGTVPTSVLELESTLDCWPIYLEAEVATTEMIASHYLANRNVLRTTSFASIPGQAGPAPTVSQGWMVALITGETTDVYRLEAATRFLEWWLSAENNANWNLAAGTLPVRRAAYHRLAEQDPYFVFLSELLETAHAYPLSPLYREVAAAWQIAIEAVLTGEQTPEEAAAQVMATLGQ